MLVVALCKTKRALAGVSPLYVYSLQPRKQAKSGTFDAEVTSCLALREGKTTHTQKTYIICLYKGGTSPAGPRLAPGEVV